MALSLATYMCKDFVVAVDLRTFTSHNMLKT